MAVFIVLWPYLLTTKLKFVIRHNLGHSKPVVSKLSVFCQSIFVNLKDLSFIEQLMGLNNAYHAGRTNVIDIGTECLFSLVLPIICIYIACIKILYANNYNPRFVYFNHTL